MLAFFFFKTPSKMTALFTTLLNLEFYDESPNR